MYNSLGVEETMEIQNSILTKLIDSSQKKLEAMHFGARKNVLEYDDVMNIQRTITYEQRRKVIDGEDMHDTFLKMIEKVAEREVDAFSIDGKITTSERYSLGARLTDIFGDLPIVLDIKDSSKDIESSNKLTQTIVEQAIDCLKEKEEFVGSDIFRQSERSVLLMSVDSKWMDHIDAMDQLQTSIRMRSLAQHDPVVEYKMEGGIMFDEMNEAIQNDSVKLLMKGKFEARQNVQVAATNANGEAASEPAKEAAPAAPMMTSKLAQAASRATASTRSIPTQAEQVKGAAQDNKTIDPVKRDKNKVGRNDPCPCGSGKKYKNCCGKNS